ncbi:MAG: hypothetical protein IJP21_01510 [Clostridia bacterium]|nr:hypothetical protein [Clostridia bacterium]
MKEEFCWCCSYFIPAKKMKIIKGKFINGICKYNRLPRFSKDKTCENFVLRDGLHLGGEKDYFL